MSYIKRNNISRSSDTQVEYYVEGFDFNQQLKTATIWARSAAGAATKAYYGLGFNISHEVNAIAVTDQNRDKIKAIMSDR
jgi:hypothetical protein